MCKNKVTDIFLSPTLKMYVFFIYSLNSNKLFINSQQNKSEQHRYGVYIGMDKMCEIWMTGN